MNRQMERAMRKLIQEFEAKCDIEVEAKCEDVVMISANSAGRKAVQRLFSDVQWSSDEKFATVHTGDWLFTHVKVTKLPELYHCSAALASTEAIGFAVAMSLQRLAERGRVCHWTGGQEDEDVVGNFYPDIAQEPNVALELQGKYVGPGIYNRQRSSTLH